MVVRLQGGHAHSARYMALKAVVLVVCYHVLTVALYAGREWKRCAPGSAEDLEPEHFMKELNATASRWMLSRYPGELNGSDGECWTTWTTIDAFYFAMTTMSTVGYGDLSPQSTYSRLVTIGVLIFGVFVVFLHISHVIYIIEGNIEYDARRMIRNIAQSIKGPDFSCKRISKRLRPRMPLLRTPSGGFEVEGSSSFTRWLARARMPNGARASHGDTSTEGCTTSSDESVYDPTPHKFRRPYRSRLSMITRHHRSAASQRQLPPERIPLGPADEAHHLVAYRDFTPPPSSFMFYLTGLTPPLFIALVLTFGSAAIFLVLVPGWSYADALYHCIVTSATVGFGDLALDSQDARLWAYFHILLSTTMLAAVVSRVNTLTYQRKVQLQRARILQRQLDVELIQSLDVDGKGVDKMEFVVGMLVKLDLIKWSEVKPFITMFDKFDADQNGVLDKHDLEMMVRATQELVESHIAEASSKKNWSLSSSGRRMSGRLTLRRSSQPPSTERSTSNSRAFARPSPPAA
ncbi:hypothetical protein AB1Y20_012000 [Prymnesium parvum]|uniref:EF-hand domain-containing protein n=1 Tax=Prymnesium parvum TaxID=97485 RepID=A0AB34INJ3_PRYPA